MKLGQIGLYVLAGYGAYSLFERFMTNGNGATSSFVGTNWQRSGYPGTYWQNQNNNFTGTNWQNKGAINTTKWQDKGVLNACGGCA